MSFTVCKKGTLFLHFRKNRDYDNYEYDDENNNDNSNDDHEDDGD